MKLAPALRNDAAVPRSPVGSPSKGRNGTCLKINNPQTGLPVIPNTITPPSLCPFEPRPDQAFPIKISLPFFLMRHHGQPVFEIKTGLSSRTVAIGARARGISEHGKTGGGLVVFCRFLVLHALDERKCLLELFKKVTRPGGGREIGIRRDRI